MHPATLSRRANFRPARRLQAGTASRGCVPPAPTTSARPVCRAEQEGRSGSPAPDSASDVSSLIASTSDDKRLPYSLICGLASVGAGETAYLTLVSWFPAAASHSPAGGAVFGACSIPFCGIYRKRDGGGCASANAVALLPH